MTSYQRVKLSELIFQTTTPERITDMRNERYLTVSLYGKGVRERVIKDGKYPVPFTGYRVSEGQFIYSRIDARNGAYGIIGPELDGFVVSKDFPVYDIDAHRIIPQFLLMSVLGEGFLRQVKNSSFGATNRMRIKEEIMEDYSILLPPLEEQSRIAENIGKVQSIIDLYLHQIQAFDRLIKARFVEMFGLPGTDIHGWGLSPLGACCEINPKKGSDPRLAAGLQVSFVPMPAVSENGDIDASDIKTYAEVKTGFTYFAENDVLFAKITPCMENGKGAVAVGLTNGIGFGSTEFHVVRPIASKSNPYWLYTLMSFETFRKDAAANMTGSAGQRRVPASFLERYMVALPPIRLQEKFATFVTQVNKSKVAVQKALDEAQLLFDSLMQEYFG